MNLTDKITKALAILVIIAAMVVESALLGGAYLTGKSGVPPIGFYWDDMAGIGMGYVSIVCQTLTLSIAVASQTMPGGIKKLLIGCYILTFTSFLTVMPVYLQASQLELSVPDTIRWYLSTVITSDSIPSRSITLLTFLYHSLLVTATQISPPMLLIALKFDVREKEDGKVVTRIRRSTEDKETTVLDAIQVYGELGASTTMISADTSIPHSTCRKVIVELEAAGKLTECQTSGKTKMYRTI